MFSARLIAGFFALGAAMLTASGADAALTIGGGPTKHVLCVAHVCRAIRPTAVLNATQLASMLALANVTVVSGSKAQDIVARYPFSWTSSHRLTLDAYRSITTDHAVTVAGPGGVTLTTNDGGTGGAFSTQFPGRIDFWDLSSSLIINGTSYTLVGDIATLASDIATNASGHYALAKNYDASVDGTYATSPIPTMFVGRFEGLGHIIDRLSIRATKAAVSLGLFVQVGTGGVVENIGLTAVSIRSGSRAAAGALAIQNSGWIINAFAKGMVHGTGNYTQIGGLVANDLGTILSSYTSGKVIGGPGPVAAVGGLVGLFSGSIRNSHSTARVVGTQDTRAGGLVGDGIGGSLTNSWASGDVSTGLDDHYGDYPGAGVGGLVGIFFDEASLNSDLKNCYATGNVTGGANTNAGGLIGLLFTYQGNARADHRFRRHRSHHRQSRA